MYSEEQSHKTAHMAKQILENFYEHWRFSGFRHDLFLRLHLGRYNNERLLSSIFRPTNSLDRGRGGKDIDRANYKKGWLVWEY